MLRNVSRLVVLRGPLQGVAAQVGKRYGGVATAYLEVSDDNVRTPAETKVEERKTEEKPEDLYDSHMIYKVEGSSLIHLNVSDLADDLQTVFIKSYLDELRQTDVNRVYINFLTEDVFRYHLNMPLRKIGYNSFFQRYNHDRGLAFFEKINPEEETQIDSTS